MTSRIREFWQTVDITQYGWTDFFNWWNVNLQILRYKLGKDIRQFDNVFEWNYEKIVLEKINKTR